MPLGVHHQPEIALWRPLLDAACLLVNTGLDADSGRALLRPIGAAAEVQNRALSR
jgi:hypothetical protein